VAGQYQNNEGSVGCIDCAAGTYSSANGSAQCTPCSTYFYAATQASTECIECPSGYIGNADNSGCVVIPGVVPTDEEFTTGTTAGLVTGVLVVVCISFGLLGWKWNQRRKAKRLEREAVDALRYQQELQQQQLQDQSYQRLPPSAQQSLYLSPETQPQFN
jgi:hypothetical protein